MQTWEDNVKAELKKVAQCPQTQDGLGEQLAALIPFANKLGLYDAADYLRKIAEKAGTVL
jgi:hypothetical protein